jgi:hypothetical protein
LHSRTRFEPGEIHRKRAVAGQAQILVPVAPILDESNIRMRNGADGLEFWTFHACFVIINPSIREAAVLQGSNPIIIHFAPQCRLV